MTSTAARTHIDTAFFERFRQRRESLSFDDAILVPRYTEIQPNQVSLHSKFSRRVKVKIPISSAAMDTVTTARLAIALAKEGGLPVLHRAFTPEEQAAEVTVVTSFMQGRVDKPLSVYEDETVADAVIRKQHNSFNSFPVVTRDGRLVGILTRTEFDFASNQPDAFIRDVMDSTIKFITAPANTTREQALEIMRQSHTRLLLLTNEGQLAGMYTLSDLLRDRSGNNHNLDDKGQLITGAAVGVGDEAYKRAELLVQAGARVIVIDTAHADSIVVHETLKRLLKAFGKMADIVPGNVSTGEAALRLAEFGPDAIKIGQAVGSICSTGEVTGCGRSQLTAVSEAAEALYKAGHSIPIIADGGLRTPGDMLKALAGGASCLMVGSLLAGTAEAPGEVEMRGGIATKDYRGMGSAAAMQDRVKDRYQKSDKFVPEGVEGAVEYRGTVKQAVTLYTGGIEKGMAENGAKTIPELWQRSYFERLSPAGIREMRPHDIIMTKSVVS